MRTDSTNLANVAVEAARELVANEYGKEFLSDGPRVYATKVKNAQEAHEAIRPAGHPFELPKYIRGELSDDEFKLFELIWKRTIASQMADARGRRLTITIEGEGCVFQVSGKIIDFAGYLRAYVEGSDSPEAELADQERLLPNVEIGEQLRPLEMMPKSHTTQPPARYSEAALTRALEELGIGRPSTYASIIDTIQARDYVFKKGNALVPTWTAFAVTQLLEKHLEGLVDYGFTAQMEDDLDAISRGERQSLDYLKKFYFGNGQPGLKQHLEKKSDEIDPRIVNQVLIAHPKGEDPIYARVGRYGPFIEQGDKRASLPDGMAPEEVNLAKCRELFSTASQADEPLGICPETNKPVFLKVGRFGPYVQRGTPEDEEKPQNASLLKGMKPEDIDLATALKLLSLPRTLGNYPDNQLPIVVYNGRFGPYVKCGEETRSLPAGVSPLDVSLQEAIELLKQPKPQRRGFGAKREPLKVYDASPVTGTKVQLLDGRYGMYVSDGETNASVPKNTSVEEVTFDMALSLLKERAAAGPSKKKPARRGRRTVGSKSA